MLGHETANYIGYCTCQPVRKILSSNVLQITLVQVLVYTASIFLFKSQLTLISLPFPSFHDLMNYSKTRQQDNIGIPIPVLQENCQGHYPKLAVPNHGDRSLSQLTKNHWLHTGTPGRRQDKSARWPLTEQRFPLRRVKTDKSPLNRNHTEVVEGRIS